MSKFPSAGFTHTIRKRKKMTGQNTFPNVLLVASQCWKKLSNFTTFVKKSINQTILENIWPLCIIQVIVNPLCTLDRQIEEKNRQFTKKGRKALEHTCGYGFSWTVILNFTFHTLVSRVFFMFQTFLAQKFILSQFKLSQFEFSLKLKCVSSGNSISARVLKSFPAIFDDFSFLAFFKIVAWLKRNTTDGKALICTVARKSPNLSQFFKFIESSKR